MTITSFCFIVFLLIGVLIYYLVPRKIQWMVLLIESLVFYFLSAHVYSLIFLIISTLTVYIAANCIDAYADKPERAKLIGTVTTIAIVVNLIMWLVLRGRSLWILGFKIVNIVFPSIPAIADIPVVGALGMGYYTFQVIGYITDVSWGVIKPQKNPVKLFLFVCFFPQLTVGPISRYKDLESLYTGHEFSYENLSLGAQRILWGFMKKLVIADRLGVFISHIWNDETITNGVWIWMIMLLYPLQLYADFSGCMDIVIGTAQLFDIKLAENFKSPFLAESVQEFWQRWHMTLGAWARDYVYYPVLNSDFLKNTGAKCKKKFGKRYGKLIPWSMGMLVLWMAIGLWHGNMQYVIGSGLYFWFIMVISEVASTIKKNHKESRFVKYLDTNQDRFSAHLFRRIRTYFLFALSCVITSAPGLWEAARRIKRLVLSSANFGFFELYNGRILDMEITMLDINILIIAVILVFIVDVLNERRGSVRVLIQKQSIIFRWSIWIALFVFVLIYGMYGPGYDAAQFIYQGF